MLERYTHIGKVIAYKESNNNIFSVEQLTGLFTYAQGVYVVFIIAGQLFITYKDLLNAIMYVKLVNGYELRLFISNTSGKYNILIP